MKSFKEYLSEQTSSRGHMSHINEYVILGGVDGLRKAINFIQQVRDRLAGKAKKPVNLTVKMDGAPAVIAGYHPENGKFFVAKKSLFNKEPKYYTTEAEVDADTSGDLAEKLKIALRECSKIGMAKGEVYQGDFLYSKKDLNTETIDGVEYITFHPNTIVYAVPKNSPLGKKILSTECGIAWHTVYRGSTIQDMKASFNEEIVSKFKDSASSWNIGLTLNNLSGNITMTERETKAVSDTLSKIGTLFKKTKASSLNTISSDSTLSMLILTYTNTYVRQGTYIQSPEKTFNGLITWIKERYQKEADKKKTQPAKDKQFDEMNRIVGLLENMKQDVINMFEMMIVFTEAKNIILPHLNRLNSMKTFIKYKDGKIKVTGHEGFVIADQDGNSAKIVDQIEFSLSNFSQDVLKGFDIRR
jgi:hypothetical protein